MYIIFLNIFALTIIIFYKLTENTKEIFKGADFIFLFFNNISYSIIASSIFWILLEYIPKKNEERKAYIFLKKDLENLENELIVLNYWYSELFVLDEKKRLSIKSGKRYPLTLKRYNLEQADTVMDSLFNEKLNSFDEGKHLLHEIKILKNIIKRILKNKKCDSLRIDLLELTCQIEMFFEDEYFLACMQGISIGKYKIENLIFSDLEEYLNKVNLFYLKLDKKIKELDKKYKMEK